MGYSIKLTGKNKKKAESLLVDVVSTLDSNHIQYALEGGTLLGIYRENRLLPWDSDLDLSILCDELKKTDGLINDLKERGYRIRTRLFENDTIPFKKGNLRIIKIRTKSFFGLLKGNVCLEIFVKYPHQDNVYWEVAGNKMAAPKAFYKDYKKIRFLDTSFFTPALTEEYLTHKYGDWKKTVKEWDAATEENSLVA
ncbi:phosphorylcholine metabolism protein LicD [Flavobacteriaceae bacterium MAR_2010_72]|nr:phosphorylcholine metabolism protein LicD [Flavobacteriaceae bacterium MAR_2010_72]